MNRKEFLSSAAATGLFTIVPGLSSVGKLATNESLPKMSEPELKNSYWYIGHLMSILISSEDSNNAFSLIHGFEIKGLEPPPHIHTREDESFYLLNGEINYTVGNSKYNAKRGDWIYLPRNIEHSFQVQTEQAEVLIHLSPGGFEKYFIEMSTPALELVVPPPPQGPPDVKRIIETASKYGIRFPTI